MKTGLLLLAFMMALAAISTPARAVLMYSEVSGEAGIGAWGYSYAQVDYDDLWDSWIEELDLVGTLSDGTTTLDEQEDCGVSYYAQVWTTGDWNGPSTYVQYGDTYALYSAYGDGDYWDYVGTSDDEVALYASCEEPEFEVSSPTGFWKPYYFAPYFYGTVEGDTTFEGRMVYEQWAGGDTNETCSGNYYLPSIVVGSGYVNSSSQYTDVVGLTIAEVGTSISNNITPCGFHVLQNMWMTCYEGFDYNYQTNELDAVYDTHSMYVTRDTSTVPFTY